ncbi:MAG: UbiD family decarboxylase [Thermodesulfobacteriota bacterium]|nr:UbiD family decarboxylase [Thermodesulfobacteriota bacterium]
MAYYDLREWISTLDKEGLLSRVECEVDWNREIGAIVREVLNRNGPALLFDNIKDHRDTWCSRLFTNGLGSRERISLALGLSKDTPYKEITRVIKERLIKPLGVKTVDTGPVKENIIREDEIDLFDIPVPQWRMQDGGRYINTYCAVVTGDPDNGLLNAGTYRGMIVGRDRIGVLLALTQHWGHHFKKYMDMGQDMPVAVVYGWDPALLMLASAPLIHDGFSEYDYVSSLRQQKCELVKCETNDLLVPASAEMVIEGFISPDPSNFMMEGPFGEYTGYYGGLKSPKPAIKVTCITYRDNPVFRGSIEGGSPHRWSEATFYAAPLFSAVAWNLLEVVGVPGVLDVWTHNVTNSTILKIRIKKAYRGHAKQVANAIWGAGVANNSAKIVIVVDEDIDIHDSEAVEWAIAYRMNADTNQLLVFPGTFGGALDPSTPLRARNVMKYGQGKWARVLVDATINWELEPQEQYGGERFPPLCTEIQPEDERRMRERWGEYGIRVPGHIPSTPEERQDE